MPYAATGEFFVGWDQEMQCAYRMRPGSRSREISKKFEQHSDSDFLWAKFSDGQAYEITDILWADFESRQTAAEDQNKCKRRRGVSPLWEGRHTASGLPVTISLRHDRELLMSLFWGPRQVCQLPVRRFPTQDTALTLMKQVGEKFCSGLSLEKELYHERDNLAASIGVSLKTRKRGAEAMQCVFLLCLMSKIMQIAQNKT